MAVLDSTKLLTRPGDFPLYIDSTILAAFRSCPRRCKLQYVDHWKPKGESVHLHAGAAFASALEVTRKYYYGKVAESNQNGGCNPGDSQKWADDAIALGLKKLYAEYGSFECPKDSAKSASRMAGAFVFYFDSYPLPQDAASPALIGGRLGIEFQFAEPLNFPHPVTGDPLLYTGRTDEIVNYANSLFVLDDKTTSSLGASWCRQWELRSQFTGYTWAAKRNGINVQGCLVRGVSILKTKYDTQQVLTYRPQWEIDRWEKQTLVDLENMKRMWEQDYWSYNLDSACNEYGGCVFRDVCKSEKPEDWLPIGFEQRIWDPLNHTELLLTGETPEAKAPEDMSQADLELQQMLRHDPSRW